MSKTMISGVVEQIGQRVTAAGITYFMVVDNVQYGCYTNKPACAQGDSVQFMASAKGNWWNADVKSIRVVGSGAGTPMPAQAPAASAPYTRQPSAADTHRQDTITYLASRKDALELLSTLASKDMLDLGKAKSAGARIEVVLSYLDGFTARLFEDAKNLGHKKESPEQPEFDDDVDDIV